MSVTAHLETGIYIGGMTTTYGNLMQQVKQTNEDDVEVLCDLLAQIWKARGALSNAERVILEALVNQKLHTEKVA